VRSLVRHLFLLLLLTGLLVAAGCTLFDGRPPTAAVSALPTTGSTPLLVRFDGSHSEDDGVIVEYAWDFGDGATSNAPQTAHAEHVYERPGTYTATLTVTDETGQSHAQSLQIDVENRLPFPSLRLSNDAPVLHERVQFDASGCFDPDGDIDDFRWDFGDGTSMRGTYVSHVYEAVGVYTMRLTVEDDAGGVASIEHKMTVHLGSTGGGGCGYR